MNERLVITERAYPSLESSRDVVLSAEASEAIAEELTVWPLSLPPAA